MYWGAIAHLWYPGMLLWQFRMEKVVQGANPLIQIIYRYKNIRSHSGVLLHG